MKGDILGSHFFWKTDCDVDTNDHKSTGVVGKAPLPQVVRMGKYLINSKKSKGIIKSKFCLEFHLVARTDRNI